MENIEGFEDSALRTIALARRESHRLERKYVGSEQILLGLIGTGPEPANLALMEFGVTLHKARIEVERVSHRHWNHWIFGTHNPPFTKNAEKIVQLARHEAAHQGKQTVRPEHLLWAILRMPEATANRVLEALKVDRIVLRKRLLELLTERQDTVAGSSDKEPAAEAKSHLAGAAKDKKARELTDWFHTDAIKVIQRAGVSAENRESSFVSIFDLHLAMSEQISDISGEAFRKIRPIPEASKPNCANGPPIFSQEILSIFEEALKTADKSTIRSRDLLFGYLSLAADGKLPGIPYMPAEHWKELRTVIQDRIHNRDRQDYKTEPVLPLQVNEYIIRVTGRLKSTLVNAKNYMLDARVGKIGPNHLVLALLDEAEISEVTFVKNREQQITEARATILSLKSDRRVSRDLLKRILDRAVNSAKRLKSNRLDINHLGLSLLNESHPAVEIMLTAMDPNLTGEKARNVLRLRLEQCMLQQHWHSRHLEPGEELDLTDIYGSLM